ncbi:MAG: tetratricopeptide repeat protein [Myxococcales bacterium]|nr:tetratricopeptide repeat protein [Myxococcales bacterium]
MAGAATTKKRFQSWQLTGKGKIVGAFPIGPGLQPEEYTELELDKDQVVGVKEFFEGHKDPLVRKPAFDAKKRLQHSDYNDPTTGMTGRNSYEYDERGCLCARQETDPNGRVRFRIEVKCDEQGRFSEEKIYDRSKRLQERHTYEYDSKGNVTKDQHFGPDGTTLVGFLTVSYDDKGRIVRREWHGADGKAKNAFAYKYDANDRRIEINVEAAGQRTMASRIEYDEQGRRKATEYTDGKGAAIAREGKGEEGKEKAWLAPPPQEAGRSPAASLEGKPLMELANVSSEQVNALATVAYSYFEKGRFQEARSLYEALASLEPKNPIYPAGAGAAALSLEQPQVAMSWYDRALARSPGHVPSLVGKAEVHLQLGNIDRALELYKEVFTQAPSMDDPVVRRARAVVTAISQAAARK